MRTYYKECISTGASLYNFICRYYKGYYRSINNFHSRRRILQIGMKRILRYEVVRMGGVNKHLAYVYVYYYSCHHRVSFHVIRL